MIQPSLTLDRQGPLAHRREKKLSDKERENERTKAIYREWLLDEHIPFPLLFPSYYILLKENEAIILTAVIIINII